MKPLLAAAALLLAVLAPYTVALNASASALPWETFSGMNADVQGVQPGRCGQEPIMVVALERGGETYLMFVAENGRFVIARMGEEAPTHIFVGSQLPSPKQDTIKVSSEHPFSPAVDGEGPCGHLFPKEA